MPRLNKSKSGRHGRKKQLEKEVDIEGEVEVLEEVMSIEEKKHDGQGQPESEDQVLEEEQDHVEAQTEQGSLIERPVQEQEKNEFIGLHSRASTPSRTLQKKRKTGKKNTPKRRKKQLISYTFTEQQEMELAEWYRDQECLYNRRIKSYKNMVMKTRLIEEKAKEFEPECSVQQLTDFLKSMRTQYSQLTNPKSGKGTDTLLSDRDQWILNTFRFLEGHIVRMKGRTLGSTTKEQVASKPREVEYSSLESDSESDEHDEQEDDIEDQISQETYKTPTEHGAGPSHVGKGKGKIKIKGTGTTSNVSSEDAMERELLQKLLQRSDEIRELRQSTFTTPPPKLTPHEEQVKSFTTYLTTQLMQVPQENWFNFTVDVMKMVQSYMNRGTSSHSSIPAPLAPPPLQPRHDEPFHPTYPPSQRAFSSCGKMTPPSFSPSSFTSRQQLPPPRMSTPPGSFHGYHAPSPLPSFIQQQNPGPSGFQRSSSVFIPQNSTNPFENPNVSPMSMLFSGAMTSSQMGRRDDVMGCSQGGAAKAATPPPPSTSN